MKSRFNINRVVMIIVLMIVSPFLPYGMITGTTLNLTDRLGWSILFGIIVIAAITLIWNLFFNRLIEIQLEGHSLKFKNIIIRKERKLDVLEIKDIKYSKWTETIDFVTSEKKIRVAAENYRNLNELIEKIKKVAQLDI